MRAYVEAKGMTMISDPATIGAMIDKVLAASPKQLEEYRGGKVKLQSFFEGQVMRESKGRVAPGLMQSILVAKLKGEQ